VKEALDTNRLCEQGLKTGKDKIDLIMAWSWLLTYCSMVVAIDLITAWSWSPSVDDGFVH